MSRHIPIALSALLLAGIAPLAAAPAFAQAAAPAVANQADAKLRQLYEAEWKWRQAEFARVEGENGANEASDHLPKVDAASQLRRLAYWQKALAELDTIPVDQLSDEERINAAVFRTSLEAFVANGKYRDWEKPFDSDSSFWAGLNPRQGYRTAEEYRRYIGRMRDIPRYFDEQMVNMRAGLKRGFSVPRATLEGRDMSIVPFANPDIAKNPFFTAFTMMPARIPAAEQEALRKEAEAAIRESVIPAYTKLLQMFRTEY
ncbi:MAG TPA: DUF885 family protein, partial [Allosphingosinicella sp.]